MKHLGKKGFKHKIPIYVEYTIPIAVFNVLSNACFTGA